MNGSKLALATVCLVTGGTLVLGGETLTVGPGKKFDKPSAAIAAAKDGDVIEIDAAGKYDGDVAYVRKNSLTIRGVGEGRAVLDSKGKVAGGKAIFVTAGNDITLENIEFRGARCDDNNGAGIRAEGKNLTVRNCKIHDCQDAILGGDKGLMVIEHNEFSYCGLSISPVTHNLYVKPEKLVYRFNYSHHSKIGHLLKSRSGENWIMYNRLSDEDGTGSYVINLPNGGRAYIVGNVLHKGPNGDNNVIIAYGEEGIKYATNELYVVNNTLVNDHPGKGGFIRVGGKLAEDFRLVARNNIFAGKASVCNWPKAVMEGNFAGDPLFADAARYDYRLKAGSPCIDKGVEPGKAGELSLKPEFQYVHPAKDEKRPDDGKIDIGAIEYSADKAR